MNLLLLGSVSSCLSWVMVACVWRFLGQLFPDAPNERSSHCKTIPRGGGIAFLLAFLLTSLMAGPTVSSKLMPMWMTITPLVVVSLLDDLLSVSTIVRLIVQLFTAGLAVYHWGSFVGLWELDIGMAGDGILLTVTILGIVALINFYNFMDGLDGLVAGCAAVQFIFLGYFLQEPALWLLSGALVGFLGWNWAPAKIFMGDVGSTSLGAIVAIALLSHSQNPAPFASAWVMTLPLVGDATYTLLRRLYQHKNILLPHKTHLYQRLHQAGLSHQTVASLFIGLQLLFGGLLTLFKSAADFPSLVITALFLGLGEQFCQQRKSV